MKHLFTLPSGGSQEEPGYCLFTKCHPCSRNTKVSIALPSPCPLCRKTGYSKTSRDVKPLPSRCEMGATSFLKMDVIVTVHCHRSPGKSCTFDCNPFNFPSPLSLLASRPRLRGVSLTAACLSLPLYSITSFFAKRTNTLR